MILFLFLLAFTPLSAVQQIIDAEIDIQPRKKVTFDNTQLSIRDSEMADLDAGYVEIFDAIIATLSANKSWAFCIRTDDTDMGTQSGYAKPISDLQWQLRGSSSYTALTGTDAIVDSHHRKVKNRRIRINVRLLMNWVNSPPGTYSLTLTFTHKEPV